MTHAIQDDSFAVDGGVAPVRGRPTSAASPGRRTPPVTSARYEHEGPFPAADTDAAETSLGGPGRHGRGERATFTLRRHRQRHAGRRAALRVPRPDQRPDRPAGPADPTEPPDPEFMFVGCPNPYEVLGSRDRASNRIEVRADRPGRQRRPDPGRARVHRRRGHHAAADHLRQHPAEPERRPHRDLPLHGDRRPDAGEPDRVRVPDRQHRRGGVARVRQPEELLAT